MKVKLVKLIGAVLLCAAAAFGVAGCKVMGEPKDDADYKTGSISGKAVYRGASDNSSVIVTLEKSDGLRTALAFADGSSRSAVSYATCAADGSFSFNNIEVGTYTVYASSSYSSYRAVSRNAVVEEGKTTALEQMVLAATGSLKGKVVLDESEDANQGFTVFLGGTNYSAITGRSGSFSITEIPAGSSYDVFIEKGTFTYFWKSVDVLAFTESDLETAAITTAQVREGSLFTDGAAGTEGAAGADGHDGKDGTSIVWKGTFASSSEIANPKYLWAFFNTTDGCSYIYNGTEWTLLAAKGDRGEKGEKGETGATGASGADGKDAVQYTISTSVVAPGDAALPLGGIKLEIFKDGVLFETKYVSNGAQGDTGADGTAADSYSIRTTDIAAGDAVLADGGIKLEVLKNGVVVETKYISNGAQGDAGADADQYSLRTTAVAAGEDANVPLGGIKLEVLKNNAVVETKYISNGEQGVTGAAGADADQYSIRTTRLYAGDDWHLPNGGIRLEVLKNGDVIETKYVANGADGNDGADGIISISRINYHLTNGSMPSSYEKDCVYGQEMTLPSPTRNNYTFVGWYYTEDFKGYPMHTLSASGKDASVDLYGRWAKVTSITVSGLTNYFNSTYSSDRYVVKITDSSPDMAAIKTALSNNESKKVILDLSGTSITSIDNKAFQDCKALEGIILPSGLTSIGTWVFSGCDSLTGIEIPSGVTSIGDRAFNNCTSLVNIKLPSGLTSLSDNVFNGCSSLTEIELPSGVTSIGDYAFYNCRALTGIELPSGLTSIGESTFFNCSALTEIELPSGVTSIGNYAFEGCSALAEIKLPSGVTSIGNYAFEGCSALAEIKLPSGVTSIGGCAFSDCSALTEIELPSGVTSIGIKAFYNCSALTEIKLPSGLTSIGNYAFYNCSALTEIELPSGLTSIGYCTFYNCSALTGIELPSGVTSIDENTFYNCSALTEIELPSGLTSIGYYAFGECSSLTSLVIPSSVTSIREYAFEGCSLLTEIELPSGVTSISEGTFRECSLLTEIELPSGITSIGIFAFTNCSALTTVNYTGTEEQWNQITIGSDNDCLTNATINYNYVPPQE